MIRDVCLACLVVRVGGDLSTNVDGVAKVGLSTVAIEASGTTSLNVASLQMQSTGRLDGSIADEASFSAQATQVPTSIRSYAFAMTPAVVVLCVISLPHGVVWMSYCFCAS